MSFAAESSFPNEDSSGGESLEGKSSEEKPSEWAPSGEEPFDEDPSDEEPSGEPQSKAFQVADQEASELDSERPRLLKVHEVQKLHCKHLSIGRTTWYKVYRPLMKFVEINGRAKVTTVKKALTFLKVLKERGVGEFRMYTSFEEVRDEIHDYYPHPDDPNWEEKLGWRLGA